MEFLLDSIHYLYNYYMVCALFPHTHHVTPSCDMWHFSILFSCVISPKEKEKKRNINNNLAVLLSHDKESINKLLMFIALSEIYPIFL